jgi:hypothetical protein
VPQACVFELRFDGRLASEGQLQFYDLAHALWGLERTISITTHLLLNGKVITQSTAAEGFYLTILPPEEGSWKVKVVLGIGSILGAFGLAPPDTQFGWLAKSAVEYVIQETLGFTPNFDETLGSQIQKFREIEGQRDLPKDLSQSRFDSVIEKCEVGLRDMHRPIVFSGTAEVAQIEYHVGVRSGVLLGHFDQETYQYVAQTVRKEDIEEFEGLISSYNINTFSGRLYIPSLNRTIPFELDKDTRDRRSIDAITLSLRKNATLRNVPAEKLLPDVHFRAFRNESVTGRLKKIYVISVERVTQE